MSIYDQFNEKERAILIARRAQRLQAETAETQSGESDTALNVVIRNENYALPIAKLTYVLVNTPVIPVPCVPPYVAGIANNRGHIIPVLDLGVLLGVPGISDDAGENTLVVATNREITVALQVGTVGDITPFLVSKVAPVPAGFESERAKAYLRGVLPNGHTLLDIEAILGDPSLTVMENI